MSCLLSKNVVLAFTVAVADAVSLGLADDVNVVLAVAVTMSVVLSVAAGDRVLAATYC